MWEVWDNKSVQFIKEITKYSGLKAIKTRLRQFFSQFIISAYNVLILTALTSESYLCLLVKIDIDLEVNLRWDKSILYSWPLINEVITVLHRY